MDHLIRSTIGRWIFRWIGGVQRRAWSVIALSLATALAALVYSAGNLTINTDTAGMINDDLPFRKAVDDYDRAFPQFTDVLAIVIDGDTPDLAEDAAAALADRLAADTGSFKSVYRPEGDPFFVRNSLLYLSPEELGDLADNLAGVQPLLMALAEDTSLRRLFGEIEQLIAERREGDDSGFDITRAFDRLATAIEATLEGRPHSLSWQEVITGTSPTVEDRRRIVLVQPRLDFSRLEPQTKALDRVRSLVRELGFSPENGVRVRLTGSVALNHDQLESARDGASIAAPLSFVLVALVLVFGLRSIRLVGAALATLAVGLVWTAAFATAAIGELNLVSVAFAVLFIGLGIDFSIHLCLRYREFIVAGRPAGDALLRAGPEVGCALVLCAATTAAGFFVFIPTDYTGVSELGLIAGVGMFIALFANLTVLPAILAAMPLPKHNPNLGDGAAVRSFAGLPTWGRRAVLVAALVLGLTALTTTTQVRFDFNPLNLHDAKAESVIALRDLLAQKGRSPWSLNVLAPSLAAAERLAARLETLAEVDKAVTIADFVPDAQDEKLALIEDMAFFMGPPPATAQALPPADESARRKAAYALRTALDDWLESGDIAPGVALAAHRLAADLTRLESAEIPLEPLERSLLGTFPKRLHRLFTSLEASEPITLNDLPEALIERHVASDGRVRVQIFPRDDMANDRALRRFVEAVRSVTSDAVGDPQSILESGDAVVRAFQQALVSAVAAIVLLILALTRRVIDALLVLAPLLLAALLTGAASVVFDIPFNFANVIVLPLLLGIGVDSAIHLLHRYRIDPQAQAGILHTSTARGVVISGLTTICSFGSLIVSSHRGAASMGTLLAIGVTFTLISTLVVFPALLRARQWRETG
ncbi:MAG: MMPL family transporter [Alphaproteobacteria bacterium]